MISHVRIQNLRSLFDTGFIEIKPLTILLGSNSSGKSTFLRSFPLFTQSVTKSLREPISWFDDEYVDFGDYDTAKSRFTPEGEGIIFSYRFKRPINASVFVMQRMTSSLPVYGNLLELLEDSEVGLSFVKDSKGGIYVNHVTFQKNDLHIKFYTKERNGLISMEVNGALICEDIKWRWTYGPSNVLVPEFEIKHSDEDTLKLDEELNKVAINLIKCHCRKNLKNTDKIRPLIVGWSENKQVFLEALRNAPQLSILRKHAQRWDTNSVDFLQIYNTIALSRVVYALPLVDSELKEFYCGCSYVAPMRAAANRYYRSQGLQVRDVDPYGRNLPEFISSLANNGRKNDYEVFMKRVLGLEVTVENSNGHLSIFLKKDDVKVNMTDVGFGYSQILPIITKLWNSRFGNVDRTRGYYTNFTRELILIEQPELHLHPAMQARTADILMLVINEMKDIEKVRKERAQKKREIGEFSMFDVLQFAPSMIIETHSQAMINRLGKRIREGRFAASDVSVLLFEKDANTGASNIRSIGYNEKGQLTNWPYGFFEPTDDDYDTLFDRQSQS